MRGRLILLACLVIAILLGTQHARAVIKADTPLKAIEGSAIYVVVGKVDKYFADKPGMFIEVSEDIKGKSPYRKFPINLKVADQKTFEKNQIGPLLKRLGPDQEIVFFLSAPRGKTFVTFAFTNGTWFQLQATMTGKDEIVLGLTSAEPYFRRSFKGTTDELRKLLKEHAAGKSKLPDKIDEKVEPGFGPEYAPKKSACGLALTWRLASAKPQAAGGQLFAVIPTVGLGAPLAILALLFPSIFGGVFVLFRQWLAFITLLSINSTVLILHLLLADQLPRGSWWATPNAAWMVMTVCTSICGFWAWRRQLNALSDGEAEAPAKTELAVLALMSASFVIVAAVTAYFTDERSLADKFTRDCTIVMTIGIVAGTLYRCWCATSKPTAFGSMPMATEGVILAAMLLAHVAYIPAIFRGGISTDGAGEGEQQSGTLSAKVGPVVAKWTFTAPPNNLGMFASSPIVEGDHIYASYSDATKRATMVCLDRHSGLQKWEFFGKDGNLRQMISTPCLHDGKLYFGEGFHDDDDCHVYCVDAEKGEEIWRVKTAGQTESSPTVAGGKVYIGAGNDGIYCLDAKTGERIWRYPPEAVTMKTREAYSLRLQRFCGAMVLVGNRLYCGGGVDRNVKKPGEDKGETGTFCFDATNGKLLWKSPAPYAVWSTPIIKDGKIYVASGNGDVFTDVDPPETPGGAMQCLDLQSGKELWIQKFNNGLIEAPAVDGHRVYVGCRDGHLYCLNRADGKERWRYFLEAPIIATPVLDSDPTLGRTLSVFTISTVGKVCCMNPQTGDIVWRFDLTDKRAAVSTSPRLVVSHAPDGYTRQLYFGCGLGGGPINVYENRPVFYCLEDKVKVE